VRDQKELTGEDEAEVDAQWDYQGLKYAIAVAG
jgi:hypothetical protein